MPLITAGVQLRQLAVVGVLPLAVDRLVVLAYYVIAVMMMIIIVVYYI